MAEIEVNINGCAHQVVIKADAGDLSYVIEKAQKLWDETRPQDSAGRAVGFASEHGPERDRYAWLKGGEQPLVTARDGRPGKPPADTPPPVDLAPFRIGAIWTLGGRAHVVTSCTYRELLLALDPADWADASASGARSLDWPLDPITVNGRQWQVLSLSWLGTGLEVALRSFLASH